MRNPSRFEKHGKYWWIMGVPEYHVDGKPEYALGGYETEKEARQAWSSLVRSTKEWWSEYGREIYACPDDYIPEEPVRNHCRETTKRRRVVASVPKRRSAEAATFEPGAEDVPALVGAAVDEHRQADELPDAGRDPAVEAHVQTGTPDCFGLLELGSDVRDSWETA